jgi:hypothetical protein
MVLFKSLRLEFAASVRKGSLMSAESGGDESEELLPEESGEKGCSLAPRLSKSDFKGDEEVRGDLLDINKDDR